MAFLRGLYDDQPGTAGYPIHEVVVEISNRFRGGEGDEQCGPQHQLQLHLVKAARSRNIGRAIINDGDRCIRG